MKVQLGIRGLLPQCLYFSCLAKQAVFPDPILAKAIGIGFVKRTTDVCDKPCF